MRIAVLDDYQRAAADSADWGALDVTFFADHLADEDALAARLAYAQKATLPRML